MTMASHLLPLLAAATTALLITPVARRWGWRLGALDHADGQRKLHASPVPYWGGLALLFALLLGSLGGWQQWSKDGVPLPLALLASAGIICLVGWLDDHQPLRVRWKLLGQFAATLPLVFSGHGIERLECGGFVLDLGWWTGPATIAWLVACANALNFLDGADGLAAGVGLVIVSAAAIIADRLGDHEAAMLAAVLAGGLTGFIFFNWQPATIYLGDSGSMTVGLWLGAVIADASREPQLGSRLVVLVALLAVPLADVALAVARRLLSRKQFWLPDRAHLHHRLMDRGRTVPQLVGLLAAASAATGLIAFLAAVHGRELLAWGSLALLAMAMLRFDVAGRLELELVCQVAARLLLRLLSATAAGGSSVACRREELGRVPLASAWSLFLTDMRTHHVEQLEIALTVVGRPRQVWQVAIAPATESEICSLEIDARGPAGECCRVRATVRQGAATAPLNWLALQERLQIYAKHWANHGRSLGALAAEPLRGLTIVADGGHDLAKAA